VQAGDDEPSERLIRAQRLALRARDKAAILFPDETWREIEERIFIAGSREPRSNGQRKTLNKELMQARILTAQGSAVYLLPEVVDPAKQGEKHPDAVVDGFLMEFKTVTGKVERIGEHYRKAREKADSVFFKIDGATTLDEVRQKLAHIIDIKRYTNGLIIAYFTETGHLQFWDRNDLK
jgi:hypothetical protein